jgi:hypothetical protein
LGWKPTDGPFVVPISRLLCSLFLPPSLGDSSLLRQKAVPALTMMGMDDEEEEEEEPRCRGGTCQSQATRRRRKGGRSRGGEWGNGAGTIDRSTRAGQAEEEDVSGSAGRRVFLGKDPLAGCLSVRVGRPSTAWNVEAEHRFLKRSATSASENERPVKKKTLPVESRFARRIACPARLDAWDFPQHIERSAVVSRIGNFEFEGIPDAARPSSRVTGNHKPQQGRSTVDATQLSTLPCGRTHHHHPDSLPYFLPYPYSIPRKRSHGAP